MRYNSQARVRSCGVITGCLSFRDGTYRVARRYTQASTSGVLEDVGEYLNPGERGPSKGPQGYPNLVIGKNELFVN